MSSNLESLLLPELRKVASDMGIPKVTGMRKSELIGKIAEVGGEQTSSQTPPEAGPQATAGGDPTHTVRRRTRTTSASTSPSSDGDEAAPSVSQEVGARLAALGMDGASEQPSSRNESHDSNGDGDDDSANARRNRRRRSRDRQGRRRTGMERLDSDPQVSAEDVLAPVKGIVDVMEGYAFVRTTGYLPSPDDAYMPLGMVRKFGLRKGDVVTGSIKLPRDGERQEKFSPFVARESVNGRDPAPAKA
ncbi:MAG: Rho termination factor N-terminal domain-containing protein, partial [Propionibacteriaceae bacterium]|nr:Rho termination factor N-terminal domain-containing protein [Propionibacteriaceae bacterium]